MEFKKLEWDSEFFGFEVAQLSGAVEPNDLNEVYQQMAAANISLAYYFADQEIHFPSHALYASTLIDIKVLYVKKIVVSHCDEHVHPYKEDFPSDKLLSLSIESGVYSRFKKDTAIPVSRYEELYKKWIINSVNKQIAEEVLIYETEGEIAGFVTVGIKNNRAELGIMAVDRNFRGKGIASALMRCAENLMANSYDEMQIVTQKNNLAACKLYDRFGYKILQTEYVYHIWKR